MDPELFHLPSIVEQQEVIHRTQGPGVAMVNQQRTTVHQIHNPGILINHIPLPCASVHTCIMPMSTIYHHPALIPTTNTAYPGAIAMPNLTPGILEQSLAYQSQRVAYIVTYSTARMAAKDPSAVALYEQAVLATGLQPIITFDVGHFPLPSPVLCAQYTGVRLPIQEVIKQSESGMRDL